MENCKGNKWTVPCHCICAEEKVESYNCCLQASAPHTGLTPVFWRSALWIIHIRAPHGIALMAVAVGCLLSVPSPPPVPQSSTYLGCSVCPAVACTGMTKTFWNLEFHAAPVKGHISVGSSLGESYNARWGTGSEKNYRNESNYPLMRMEKSGFCIEAAKHLPSAGRNRGGRRKSLVLSEMKNKRCKNQCCLKFGKWNIISAHKASSVLLCACRHRTDLATVSCMK